MERKELGKGTQEGLEERNGGGNGRCNEEKGKWDMESKQWEMGLEWLRGEKVRCIGRKKGVSGREKVDDLGPEIQLCCGEKAHELQKENGDLRDRMTTTGDIGEKVGRCGRQKVGVRV